MSVSEPTSMLVPKNRSPVLVVALVLGLASCTCALAASPEEDEGVVSVRYFAWKSSSGEVFGQAVDVRRKDELVIEDDLLIETPEHHRIALVERFVPSRDLMVAKLVDKTSGWSAQLEMRIGLGDLGEAAGWNFERHAEVMRRMQEEELVPVFTLDTPEIHLRAEDRVDEEGRGAIERLADELSVTGVLANLPPSVLEGLSFALRVFDSQPAILREDLVEILAEAAKATGTLETYDEVEWETATGSPERPGVGETLPGHRFLESFGPIPGIERIEAIREEEKGADRS